MRWMISWHDGMSPSHRKDEIKAARTISNKAGFTSNARASRSSKRPLVDAYYERLLIWLRAAEIGDVLEFPQGIVVRTSEHATEIGYDREETGS